MVNLKPTSNFCWRVMFLFVNLFCMKKILGIYISNYNLIGGVERFVENFCKRMSKHYKIIFIYDWCESNDLLYSISDYADVIKINKQEQYFFDLFVNSTAWGYSPYENINADKIIQVVHADYKHVIANWNFKYVKHKKTTHHVCVGEIVKSAFEEVTGLKCDAVIYNLLDNEIKLDLKPKNKILNLITCSRLSGEKGFKRMLDFANQLDAKEIPYIWNIYGNTSKSFIQSSSFPNSSNSGTFKSFFNIFSKGMFFISKGTI